MRWLWVALLLVGCRHRTPAVEAAPAKDLGDRFVIAHTGDLHANLRPSPARWSPDRKPVGGALGLSAHLEILRAEWGDRVLLLDAGDLRSGTPFDEYEIDGVAGGVLLEWLDVADYDAWAIGNHEFDRGTEDASAFFAASDVTVLSVNLDAPDGSPGFANVADSHVFEIAGSRVGVIGVTTDGLFQLTSTSFGDLVIVEPEDAVRAEAARLRPDVDVLVALTHLGIEEDRELAKAVPELDLILGGHSHTRMRQPEQVDDVWIAHPGCCGQSLGVAVIDPDESGPSIEWHLEVPDPDALPGDPSPEVRSFVDEWDARMRDEWDEVIARSELTLTRSYRAESSLGRFVGQTMARKVDADVGLYNAGGLRADLETGEVRRQDVYRMFPFGNEIVVAEVTGEMLLGLALRNAAALADPEGRSVLQQWGLEYTWRPRMGAQELVEIKVGEAFLDPDAVYKVATNSFMADHWDNMLPGEPLSVTNTGVLVRDAVEERLRAEEVLSSVPAAGGRPHQ